MGIRAELQLASLAGAILVALGLAPRAQAATIVVDHNTCALANAIDAANFDMPVNGCTAGSGRDKLEIRGSASIGGFVFPAITTDMDLIGDLPNTTLTAATRPFFVGGAQFGPVSAPTVTFANLTIENAVAQGGDGGSGPSGGSGAGGAGLGGALFVYDGNVTIRNVTFRNSSAVGGSTTSAQTQVQGGGGGGGMSGPGGIAQDFGPGMPGVGFNFGGGGGAGGDVNAENAGFSGGNGGYFTGGLGAFFNGPPAMPGMFGGGGGGGAGANPSAGAAGGFGGGGGGGGGANTDAGRGGDGGFGGGGGGGGGAFTNGGGGGNGGFGGGGGSSGGNETGSGPSGINGFGGGDGEGSIGGGGGGFGGAIFVRTGFLNISRSTFETNTAAQGIGGNGGTAKGGAIALLDPFTMPSANMSGYPDAPGFVMGCENTFTNNSALFAQATDLDNEDTFGVPRFPLVMTICDELFRDGFE